MVVGIARLTFFIPASHSLKDKRMVVRRVKDKVRARFNAAIAEVSDQDVWQKGVLGVAVVGNESRFVGQALDEVVRLIRAEAEVTNVERELQVREQPLAHNDLGFRYE
ncbi:MAG: DUF503 domain-containing protein [Deltaproteobacteria bacterium]|nr:DUF503 domain-containing protein [Deltaproteobacteria bacterium]